MFRKWKLYINGLWSPSTEDMNYFKYIEDNLLDLNLDEKIIPELNINGKKYIIFSKNNIEIMTLLLEDNTLYMNEHMYKKLKNEMDVYDFMKKFIYVYYKIKINAIGFSMKIEFSM